MLSSHFVTFHKGLRSCSKLPVRFLARVYEDDLRTVHGRNVYEITKLCGLESCEIERLSPSIVKKSVTYREIPTDESWREELLAIRDDDDSCVPGFDDDDLESILSYICIT